MKCEFHHQVPTPLDRQKSGNDKSRQKYSQWTFGQRSDSEDQIKNEIPEPLSQKTAIERIEENQAQREKKTQDHVDARAQRLIAINHGRPATTRPLWNPPP